MAWQTSESVDAFLDHAGDFLRARPVEHTMALTLTTVLRENGPHAFGPDDPVFGWWTSPDGRVDGAFLQTPPHPLLLSPMPADAVTALPAVLSGRPLPGVNARCADADAFAAQWRRRTGMATELGRRTRLFRLDRLASPATPPGAPRVAIGADRDLLIAWFDAFLREIGEDVRDSFVNAVDDKLSYGGLTLWETDAEPVSMCGVSRPQAGMVRIASVYTPPGRRGRGYAGAATAAVTQAALDAGATDVVLFTDLANPISNALYVRLGYRPVEDRSVVEFTA